MTINHKRKNGFNGRAEFPLLAKLISVGYDDGPTSGVAESTDGSSAYRFELLATDVDGVYDREAWDRGEELRVYSLTRLPQGSFDRIVAILSQVEHPTWPIWVPGVKQPSPAVDELIIREVEPILRRSEGKPYVVATDSLNGSPRAVDRLHDRRESQDWFALLGLEPVAVPN